jgi:branched-chain amino acid transport system substrate-binding protein
LRYETEEVEQADERVGKGSIIPRIRRVFVGALCSLILGAACALPKPSSLTDDINQSVPDVGRGRNALAAAWREYEASRYVVALNRADSLFASWRNQATVTSLADSALWLAGLSLEAQGLLGAAADRYEELTRRGPEGSLRDQVTERWVQVLGDTGREFEAVKRSLENHGVLSRTSLKAFRRWVSILSAEQLQSLASTAPPEALEATIVHVHLAELLVVAGHADEASQIATAVLQRDPVEPERERAELLVSVVMDPLAKPVKFGAILPLTGELAAVGEWLREGIELAVELYERSHPDGFDLELVILDDSSVADEIPALMAELESEKVLGIIGPMGSEAFATAVGVRRDPKLPMVSPTATEVQRPHTNAYTLYDLGTRELDVAVDLAHWVVGELGLKRVGVLYPKSGRGQALSAFEEAIVAGGGVIVAQEVYDPTLTTFQEPIEAIAEARPDVIYAPAPTPPIVLSLAPQLFYYGLYRHIILGSEAWADPTIMRRLETFASDYRVVGLWVDRMGPETQWQQFRVEYEKKYRKALRDNILPGLGYDAAAVLIAALETSRVPIKAALAGYFADTQEINGVTGFFSLDPQKSTVHRKTEVRMLRDKQLHPADRSELMEWLFYAKAAPSPFAPRGTIPQDSIPRDTILR